MTTRSYGKLCHSDIWDRREVARTVGDKATEDLCDRALDQLVELNTNPDGGDVDAVDQVVDLMERESTELDNAFESAAQTCRRLAETHTERRDWKQRVLEAI